MTPIYAFDIDGTLCHTREQHRREIEAELGVILHEGGDYDTWGFHHDSDEVMAFLREKALALWKRPRVFANGTPAGGEVLRTLAERGQLAGYVTRRDPTLYADTLKWLYRVGFPLSHSGWTSLLRNPPISRHEQLHHMAGDESKAQAARALGATTLVEDSPSEARRAAEDGLSVVVLRQPYNQVFEREVAAWSYVGDIPEWVYRVRFIDALEDLL